MTAMQRHLAAINAGNVTKTNVIGLRKALNHNAKLERGWGGDRVAATPAETAAAMAALAERCPIVRGELHASGVRLITGKRYAKRLAPVADKIAALQGFSLVGFHRYAGTNHVPVYRAWGSAGTFDFYNLPWQAAMAYGLESGPQLIGSN